MKKRLVVPLAGLAISFALPTYAQQKDVADPQTTQKILAMTKAGNDAHDNNDAPPLPRNSRATEFLLRQRGQTPVGKPFRNGIQSCTGGGTPKTTSPSWTGMPFT